MTARLIEGDSKAIKVDVKGGVVIHQGDEIWLHSDGYCYPASAAELWNTNIATTLADLHTAFVGISMDQRMASQTADGKILVATDGVFQMTFSATTQQEIGTMVKGVQDGANVYLLSSQVQVAAAANLAIGRLAERVLAGATTAKVRIESTIITGGVQAAAS